MASPELSSKVAFVFPERSSGMWVGHRPGRLGAQDLFRHVSLAKTLNEYIAVCELLQMSADQA
jgi:hypothetical protein